MNRLALTSVMSTFAAVLGVSVPAHAFTFTPPPPVALSSLTGANSNNSLTDIVGNVYDHFDFQAIQNGPNNIPLTAANVFINTAPFDLGGSGIVITGAFIADSGQSNDYTIDYRVTPVSGNVINSLSLDYAANVTGAGTVGINEDISHGLGSLAVTYPPGNTPQTATFNPGLSQAFVQKDISLSVDGTGTARVSSINQFLSTGPGQVTPPPPVPEPSEVLGTLAFAGIGVGSYLRRLQLKKHREAN